MLSIGLAGLLPFEVDAAATATPHQTAGHHLSDQIAWQVVGGPLGIGSTVGRQSSGNCSFRRVIGSSAVMAKRLRAYMGPGPGPAPVVVVATPAA
jgi:hypothetical protein